MLKKKTIISLVLAAIILGVLFSLLKLPMLSITVREREVIP